MLVLDMIETLPPLRKYKYDTWRILSVKCYIDNSVRLWSCIRNVKRDYQTLLCNWVVIKVVFEMKHGIGM
jgi:hypothetical protein